MDTQMYVHFVCMHVNYIYRQSFLNLQWCYISIKPSSIEDKLKIHSIYLTYQISDISLSNISLVVLLSCAWLKLCLSHCDLGVTVIVIPRTIAHQAPLSMGFSRQEYWSGLPFPPPEDLPVPGLNPLLLCPLHWQADSLPLTQMGAPEFSLAYCKCA